MTTLTFLRPVQNTTDLILRGPHGYYVPLRRTRRRRDAKGK
jgi:hypothetical protein